MPEESKTAWSQVMARLVKLATDTVSPDVRGGDQVDIRPYVQVKVREEEEQEGWSRRSRRGRAAAAAAEEEGSCQSVRRRVWRCGVCLHQVIPGGDMSECAYVDGLVFRKNLAHKRMATELRQPRIMLLSGGIEFQRTESRITSLETLVDQEARYMQILVRLYI